MLFRGIYPVVGLYRGSAAFTHGRYSGISALFCPDANSIIRGYL